LKEPKNFYSLSTPVRTSASKRVESFLLLFKEELATAYAASPETQAGSVSIISNFSPACAVASMT
jgi:hypothetical protein